MSTSMRDDYFSFMSDKWEHKGPTAQKRKAAAAPTNLLPSDTIDFVEDSQMEVTESFVSDTVMLRLFKDWSEG